MEIRKINTELYCVKCKKETLHEITYAGEKIVKMVCTECDRIYHANEDSVRAAFTDEVIHRIRTKPKRIGDEVKHHPLKSVVSMPARVITKLFRIEKEFEKIKDNLK